MDTFHIYGIPKDNLKVLGGGCEENKDLCGQVSYNHDLRPLQ